MGAPDFSLVDDGKTAAGLTQLSKQMDDQAGQMLTTIRGFSDDRGETITDNLDKLANIRNELTDAATDYAIVAASAKMLKAAVDRWRADAPSDADIACASDAADDAQAEMMDAPDGQSACAAQKDFDTALATLNDLESRRKAADDAFVAAAAAARDKLATTVSKDKDKDKDGKHGDHTGDGTLPGQKPGAHTAAPAAPGGAPAHMPSTPTPATPSPVTAPSSASNSDTLATIMARMGQVPQPAAAAQPAAQGQPQPTLSPAAAAGAPSSSGTGDRKNGAIGLRDLDSVLGPEAATLAGGLGGLAAVTPPPGTAATTTTSAADPAAAAPSPGTSVTGLHTTADVSGRSEAARTAFTPAAPTTSTSAATGTTSASNTDGANARGMNGANPAMGSPMMGAGGLGAAGGSGGGAAKERSVIKAYQSEDDKILHGGYALGETVRGGTIAQNIENPEKP